LHENHLKQPALHEKYLLCIKTDITASAVIMAHILRIMPFSD